jgi:hypothetical protein
MAGRATTLGYLGESSFDWNSAIESISKLATGVANASVRPIVLNTPSQANVQQYANTPTPQPKDNTLLYVGIAAGVLAVGGVATYLIIKN